MQSNTFLILVFIFLGNEIIMVIGDDEPKEDDLPKTVWDFIYGDWKQHIDANTVDLPDLYALFAEGWVPPEEPKKPKDRKKRSHHDTKVNKGSKINSGYDLVDFRNWITDYIEQKKYMRSIENSHLNNKLSSEKENLKSIKTVPENYIELRKQNLSENDEEGIIKLRMISNLEDSKDKVSEILENNEMKKPEGKKNIEQHITREIIKNTTMKAARENPNKIHITDGSHEFTMVPSSNLEEIISSPHSVRREVNDSPEFNIPSRSPLNDHLINHARRLKRFVVEEVETPSYFKFFSKCNNGYLRKTF